MRAEGATSTYEVHNLTKVYGGKIVANDHIAMTIETGSIVGVLGPNGAGKTTLLRQLVGFVKPTTGTIRLFGKDVLTDPSRVPHYVSFFGQQTLMLRAHRFIEVMQIAGLLRGQTSGEAKQQSLQLIERFEVAHLRDKLVGHLSGGERRLSVLLAAFMGNRPVLVLDEPTNDLDPRRRQLLWDYLHERNATDATTIIVVSHELPELEPVIHKVVLIDHGRIIADGSLGELKRTVAEEVRVELRLRRESPEVAGALTALDLDGVRQLRPGVWAVYSRPTEVGRILQRLLEQLGTEVVDDFRVITPTLDDVYMHYTSRGVVRESVG